MITFLLTLQLAGFIIGTSVLIGFVGKELRATRYNTEVARLTFELPPIRESLLPEDWPTALHPLTLPGIGHTKELAAMAPRILHVTPVPVVAELGEATIDLTELAQRIGRHAIGVAPGTAAQQARWNSPTGQFWQIVDELGDLGQPCSHCTDPEEGEPAHAGCPGCACVCGLVEVAA